MEIPALDRECIITILTRVRRNRSTITYGELADDINARAEMGCNAHFSFNHVLARLQEYCRDSGVPCLPCMVVSKQRDSKPAEGFITEYRHLNPGDARSDRDIIRDEQNACRDFDEWEKLLSHCGIEDWDVPAARDIRKELTAKSYVEGAVSTTEKLVKEVKRDQEARNECLRIQGTRCAICGFDSKEVYGVPGIVHVHHLHPIWEGKRSSDPAKDMIPVCPNCHALIHSKGGRECYEPEEVRRMLEEHRASNGC